MESSVHKIERAWRRLVLHCRPDWLASDDALKTEIAHQALDGAACDRNALPIRLPPDLARAIYLEVLGEDASDLRPQVPIPLRPC
jgi:hypothetical protein